MLVLGGRGAINPVMAQGRGGGSNGLLTGLVAYWGLDEASGNALDKHSNGLTLTQVGTVSADTGKVYATARSNTGTSSNYFNRASDAYTTTGNVDYAFAVWLYFFSKSDVQRIIAKCNAGYASDWEYEIDYLNSTDRFRFLIGNGTALQILSASTFGAVPIATWMLLIVRHVAATKTIYISINNGAEDSLTYTGTHDTTTQAFAIGRIDNLANTALNGRIGPVAFWKNRTLSAADRTALWNGGAGLAYAGFS